MIFLIKVLIIFDCHFLKKGGEIESYTSHYVASQAISKVFGLIFWIMSFKELNIGTSLVNFRILN